MSQRVERWDRREKNRDRREMSDQHERGEENRRAQKMSREREKMRGGERANITNNPNSLITVDRLCMTAHIITKFCYSFFFSLSHFVSIFVEICPAFLCTPSRMSSRADLFVRVGRPVTV